MKYIYGPVKSRRLGFSLGLTITPPKICNFDCIYCQLGRTSVQTSERKEYFRTEEIMAELRSWLQNNTDEAKNLNYITISGSGEPTLNIKIGELIFQVKNITTIPVAVITNASLLNDIAVRNALKVADLLVPSLDTVIPKIFKLINRPHQDIRIEDIINGLISFRREFKGKIWLEVMLARSVNDDLRQIKKLRNVIDKINPDKIQLNSPVRSTSEPNVFPVDRKKLEKIKEILGDKCEII